MKTILIRTSLIVAVTTGLTVGGLNLLKVRGRITTLQSLLTSETAALAKVKGELAGTRSELQTAATALAQTKLALEVTTADEQKALDKVASQTKQLAQLRGELEETRAQREAALAELAPFQTLGLTAEELARAGNELKRLREALVASAEEERMLVARLKRFEPTRMEHVRLPLGLTGKIIACDPKWQFVVLDVGGKAGMLDRGELLVSRNGKLVGKVKVSRVERDRAIGNVLPGWGLGEVLEGDLVIPAYPES